MKESYITVEVGAIRSSFWVRHNLHKFGISIDNLADQWEAITLTPSVENFCWFVKSHHAIRNVICQPVK